MSIIYFEKTYSAYLILRLNYITGELVYGIFSEACPCLVVEGWQQEVVAKETANSFTQAIKQLKDKYPDAITAM